MFLEVFADSGQVYLHIDAGLLEHISLSDTRELKDLRRFQSAKLILPCY